VAEDGTVILFTANALKQRLDLGVYHVMAAHGADQLGCVLDGA
jgi:hypothetical protein